MDVGHNDNTMSFFWGKNHPKNSINSLKEKYYQNHNHKDDGPLLMNE
jgi:hypothetical protein